MLSDTVVVKEWKIEILVLFRNCQTFCAFEAFIYVYILATTSFQRMHWTNTTLVYKWIFFVIFIFACYCYGVACVLDYRALHLNLIKNFWIGRTFEIEFTQISTFVVVQWLGINDVIDTISQRVFGWQYVFYTWDKDFFWTKRLIISTNNFFFFDGLFMVRSKLFASISGMRLDSLDTSWPFLAKEL